MRPDSTNHHHLTEHMRHGHGLYIPSLSRTHPHKMHLRLTFQHIFFMFLYFFNIQQYCPFTLGDFFAIIIELYTYFIKVKLEFT